MTRPTVFVSPLTRKPLMQDGERLVTSDGSEAYPVEDGVALLCPPDAADADLRREAEVFDTIPLHDVSYFRPGIYRAMLGKLFTYLDISAGSQGSGLRFAELGGGEGHCARYVKAHGAQADVFVCDISRAALSRAPGSLQRVCADITRPVFAPGTLQAAAFWVSLHHIPEQQRRQAITEVFDSLAVGGVLIVFEPNNDFFVRRLLYNSRLSRDVYFDEQEAALDFTEVAVMAQEAGFEELETRFVNPPYNPEFVRLLRGGWLYLPVVEFLHMLGGLVSGFQCSRHTSLVRYSTLYGMGIFRKPHRIIP